MFNEIRRRLAKFIYHHNNFETYFNVPIKFDTNQDWTMNERIVEWAFVLSHFGDINHPKKILDFGCSRGWLPLALSSLGNKVVGVDFRDFPFDAIGFDFQKRNILDIKENKFDYIISLSTLEHVGLGAYNEDYDEDALHKVVQKINQLLEKDGLFILTLPVGKSSIDCFMRSFSPEEIKELLVNKNFKLYSEYYFKRTENKYWSSCSSDEISGISNDMDARNKAKNGVIGLGCLTFSKEE